MWGSGMNRDDIIRMALESGFSKDYSGVYFSCGGSVSDSDLTLPLKRFAALVAAHEREACARLCEEIQETCWESWDTQADPLDQGSAICAGHCAAAIRARGKK